MPIPDLTTNRYHYRPRGNAEMFEGSFPMLKDILKDRFNLEMRFEENTVVWDSDKKEVIFTFPVVHSNELYIAVSNFIFGAFEIKGF